MIYELIGLPGSGKTYYFLNQTKYKKINVNSFEIIIFLCLGVIIYLKLFLYFLSLTLNNTKQNIPLLMHKLNLLFRNFAKFQKARLHSQDVIIDEGLLYYLITVFETEKETRYFKSVLEKINLKKIKPFLVSASTKERYERMRRRKRIPREKFGNKYSTKYLKVLERNYSKFVSIFKI